LFQGYCFSKVTNNEIQGFSKQENSVCAFVDGTFIEAWCNGFKRIPQNIKTRL